MLRRPTSLPSQRATGEQGQGCVKKGGRIIERLVSVYVSRYFFLPETLYLVICGGNIGSGQQDTGDGKVTFPESVSDTSRVA